jgi:DNA-binding CsgD family transcriptional regulator
MKSQILPLTLCLIMATLLYSIPHFSTIKKLNNETTSSDNLTIQNIPKKTSEISTSENLSRSGSDSKTAITNEDALGKIISYDSAAIVATGYNDSQVTGDSSLFRKGMFYGLAVMVILLNFICFFLFEEKMFLYFSLSLTTLGATFINIDSLFPLIGINGIENIEAMQSTMFFIATAFGALFASKYLTLEEFYPKLKWVAASILGFSFIMISSSWVSEIGFYNSVANIANFSVLALYFLAGVNLFSKKTYAKFYVIALAIPLLFSLDFFVFKKLGIYFLSTENSHLKAATIVEMFLMTFAIVYRMRAIKEEHDMRKTEMRIFLKRHEVLNKTNTQELMPDMHLENLIMQFDLDGRQIKLLQYISEGKNNARIARKLKTTEREIELYTKELYNKLEIKDNIEEDYRMVEAQADYIYN